MNIQCQAVSLVTLARQRPATLCATVGVLCDAGGGVIAPAEAQTWLARRFAGESYDRGQKKARGTFAVHGTAHPRTPERRMRGMAVRASVGALVKTLHVQPPRQWQPGLLGWTAAIRGALDPLPLDLRQAFGGEHWPDNPEGTGHAADPEQAAGTWLPQIEEASRPLLAPAQTPRLASFLPLPPQSAERRRYWGSADESWARVRAPYPPLDCDDRWFDEVAADQTLSGFWRGDEPWEAIGMHPTRDRVTGRLPSLRPRLFIKRHAQDAPEERPLALDTVWLFPDAERVLMLYRAELEAAGLDGETIEALGAVCEGADAPVDSAHTWCERLWPSAISAAPKPPPAPVEVDTQAMVDRLQASLDAQFAAFAAEQDALEAQAVKAANRMGRSIALERIRIAAPDLSAPRAPATPRPPFDAKALKADIQAEIDAAKAQGERRLDQTAKRLGMAPASLHAHIERVRHAPPARPDPAAAVDKLDLAPARQAELKAQITRGMHDMRATEAEIETNMQTLKAKFPATDARAAPPPPSPRAAWTREALAASHAQGTALDGERFVELDLSGIDLTGGRFAGCRFERCRLTGTLLGGADLSGCVLTACEFDHADLEAASLDNAMLLHCQLQSARLARSSAAKLMARHCVFGNADLSEARWPQSVLIDCELRDLQAMAVELVEGRLQRCDLANANLASARLGRSAFDACRLDRLDLTQAQLDGASWSRVAGAEVNLTRAGAPGLRIDQTQALSGLMLEGADLSDASLQNVDLAGCDLRDARLDRALVANCNLNASRGDRLSARGTDFTGSRLEAARWPGANLLAARLRRVSLEGADLSDSNLHAVVSEGARGSAVRLDEALLTRCRLREDLAHA